MTIKRKAQKERTREVLLDIAYQEFSKRGILATKTLEVAQSAQVAHGTLFAHFSTRDDLLMRVIDEFGMKVGTKLKQLAEHNNGVQELLEAHLAVIQEYEPFYAQLVIEGPLLPSPIRTAIFMIQSGLAHYLAQAVKKDSEKGLIRLMPIPLMLNTWLGLIHYYLTHRDLFAPEESVIALHGKKLINHYINCIKL
jgi:AcrR family transcriptional regulator